VGSPKKSPLFKKITSSLRSGGRILRKSFRPEKPIQWWLSDIIRTIHAERFAPEQQYCITGGHFSDLYVRNSGIFYNALLDGRIALDEIDWNRRVDIALRTTESILSALRKCGKLTTTFSFHKNGGITGANYYAEPSDSLHGLLWNLCAFQDESFISNIFPVDNVVHKFNIADHQRERIGSMKKKFQKDIEQEFQRYSAYCMSQKNHRISKKIILASARDGVKRRSSFYDNVIYWRTAHMMHMLGFSTSVSLKKLDIIKAHILQNFWNAEKGIFLDDLSRDSLNHPYFCADSLIAVSTRFLRPEIPEERKYLEKMVEYIQKNRLDEPFGIHYSENRTKRHWAIIFWAPQYADYTLWSHWSTEYIKLLILLWDNVPENEGEYYTQAKTHIHYLEQKMLQYGGYPELYDLQWNIYKSRLYRSVLRCSWVVGYEQAKYMLAKIESQR
jgi:hypothetical protein